MAVKDKTDSELNETSKQLTSRQKIVGYGWTRPPKNPNQSLASIKQHTNTRERTLAAVLKTIAEEKDRGRYTKKSTAELSIVKLAQLVEDNRLKYEKRGKILSLEQIKKLLGEILNGNYFPK